MDESVGFPLPEEGDTLIASNPQIAQGLLRKLSAATVGNAVKFPLNVNDDLHSTSREGSAASSSSVQPVVNQKQKKRSAAAIGSAVRVSQDATNKSSPVQPAVDHGLLKKFSAAAVGAASAGRISPDVTNNLASSSGGESSSSPSPTKRSGVQPVLDHGLLKKFSAATIGAAVRIAPDVTNSSPRGSTTDSFFVHPVVENLPPERRSTTTDSFFVHPGADSGLLKTFSPEAIDAAVRFRPQPSEGSEAVDDADPNTESDLIDPNSQTSTPTPHRARTLPPSGSRSTSTSSRVEEALGPPKIGGQWAKQGGVLDVDEPKSVRICVLGVRGRVLYLEAYKDFVDLLLNFLTMRTGAVIKLIREVEILQEGGGGGGGGILNVYDSLSKLNSSNLIGDKDLLLGPVQKLNLTRELHSLDSFDPECCNAECPKYMAGSRVVCKNCTISNHFSCSICNVYFRDNVHTSMCYAPWRPWGTHVSAAPVLNRYTVVQSMGAIPAESKKPRAARGGFVKNGVPFMITNELTISPLTTRSIAKVLKTLDDQDGKTERLDCHELLIGKNEVVFLLGAAMISLTPLTDVFAKMCNAENKILAAESLSGSSTFSEGLSSRRKKQSGTRLPSIARPLGDLMTYVRPLASGFADALQQGTAAALQGLSESELQSQQQEALIPEVFMQRAANEISPPESREKKSPSVAKIKGSGSSIATTSATAQALYPETLKAAEDTAPPAAEVKKSLSVAKKRGKASKSGLSVIQPPPLLPPDGHQPEASVAKTRGKASKSGLSVIQLPSLLAPDGQQLEASPQTLFSTSPEVQQKQEGDQPPAELLVRRRSSGIAPHQSIFLAAKENEGTPSPSSSPSESTTPRRGFFNKFFRSKVVQSNKISAPDLSATPSSNNPATPPSAAPDINNNELPLPTPVEPVAENDPSQPSPPSETPTPAPKKRRGWFKFFSPKSAKPLPNQPPPIPPETLSPESGEPPAEDDSEQSSAPITPRKSKLVAPPEAEDEEEEDEAATSSPAVDPSDTPEEDDSAPDPNEDAEDSSPSVPGGEVTKEFSFESGGFR